MPTWNFFFDLETAPFYTHRGLFAAAIITGLRLARDPRARCKMERVINALEDGIFLANQIHEKTLLRFGQGNIDFKW
jgi:hypothetical protein